MSLNFRAGQSHLTMINLCEKLDGARRRRRKQVQRKNKIRQARGEQETK